MSEPHRDWRRDGFVVTTDPARFDVHAIHAFLSTSYWAEGRPLEVVERSIRNSLCFGLLEGGRCVMAHPDLQGLRRFTLVTQDAHGLYRKFGFEALPHPERYMERATRSRGGARRSP